MANTEKVGILTHIDDDGNKTELYPVVKTDSTLTTTGTPADAAATGAAVAEATNIAKGRNRARVFATTADMETWLKTAANKGVCNVGDNLYIVQVDVPDWWVSEVLTTADSTTGYYYKIAKLETQKVDLTNYLPKSGGQITGNITGNANNFTIAASGDIKSDKWGGSWLSTKLSNYDVAVTSNATNANDLINRFGKVCKIITDWNAITESGFYMASNASNAPTTGWFMGIVIVHNSNYIIQELWSFTGGDANTLCGHYVRQKCTSWREWNNIPLAYLEGVTSNIQTQLNSKYGAGSQPLFSGIGIGASGTQAYIYSEGENVNFRYKDGSGNVKYSSLRAICKGSLSGTTLTITI